MSIVAIPDKTKVGAVIFILSLFEYPLEKFAQSNVYVESDLVVVDMISDVVRFCALTVVPSTDPNTVPYIGYGMYGNGIYQPLQFEGDVTYTKKKVYAIDLECWDTENDNFMTLLTHQSK